MNKKIFILFNLVQTSKCPSPSASLLKTAVQPINGMCAVHPFERSIAVQLCSRLNRRQRSQIRATEFFPVF